MVQLLFNTGAYPGSSGWLQLNYSTATGGIYSANYFDAGSNFLGAENGTFGQQ